MQLNTGNVFCKRGSVSLFQIFILMFSLVAFSYMIGAVDGEETADEFIREGGSLGDWLKKTSEGDGAAEESVMSDVQWEKICAKLSERGQRIADGEDVELHGLAGDVDGLDFLVGAGVLGATDKKVPVAMYGEITIITITEKCHTRDAGCGGCEI